jgi:hypothetical protein
LQVFSIIFPEAISVNGGIRDRDFYIRTANHTIFRPLCRYTCLDKDLFGGIAQPSSLSFKKNKLLQITYSVATT